MSSVFTIKFACVVWHIWCLCLGFVVSSVNLSRVCNGNEFLDWEPRPILWIMKHPMDLYFITGAWFLGAESLYNSQYNPGDFSFKSSYLQTWRGFSWNLFRYVSCDCLQFQTHWPLTSEVKLDLQALMIILNYLDMQIFREIFNKSFWLLLDQ